MYADLDLNLMPQVVAIAQQAGRAVLSVYESDGDYSIAIKADESPVTAADTAAHKLIAQGLSALLPNVPVVSEEAELVDYQTRRSWTRYWLVDPLDGTREFIHRTGEFTVNIALIDRGVPALGVVYVPVSDTVYTGICGGDAYKIEGRQRQLIRVRHPLQHLQPVTMVVSRYHGSDALLPLKKHIEAALGVVNYKPVGSSLKMCLIAEGEADIYPRFGPTCEWDTAAAQAVIEAAGGRVVNHQWQPLSYNQKSSILNPEFFVLGDKPEFWQKLLMSVSKTCQQ